MTQETGAASNNARRIKGDSPAEASPTTCSQLASRDDDRFLRRPLTPRGYQWR